VILISWLHLGLALAGTAVLIMTAAWLAAWLLGLID
jgi:hypothetical protein